MGSVRCLFVNECEFGPLLTVAVTSLEEWPCLLDWPSIMPRADETLSRRQKVTKETKSVNNNIVAASVGGEKVSEVKSGWLSTYPEYLEEDSIYDYNQRTGITHFGMYTKYLSAFPHTLGLGQC